MFTKSNSQRHTPVKYIPDFRMEFSIDIWTSVRAVINPFTTGNPFLGTLSLGFSIGRGSGALKGFTQHGLFHRQIPKNIISGNVLQG